MQPDSRQPYGVDPRDLRVGDAEREHVAGLLQKAVGRGMLSLGEFTERVDTAFAARTRGELNAVIIDLPGLELRGAPGPGLPVAGNGPTGAGPQPPAPGFGSSPGYAAANEEPVVINNTMSTVNRKGDWQVPARMRIVSKLATVKLNYSKVTSLPPVIEVTLDDYGSTMHFVLPEGATADLRGLEVSAGTVHSHLPGQPGGSGPHLVLSGHTRLGTVTVRPPRGRRRQ